MYTAIGLVRSQSRGLGAQRRTPPAAIGRLTQCNPNGLGVGKALGPDDEQSGRRGVV